MVTALIIIDAQQELYCLSSRQAVFFAPTRESPEFFFPTFM